MRLQILLILLATFLNTFVHHAFAQEELSNNQEHRIQLGVDLIKLGCGTGSSSKKTEVKAHGDLSFTLRKLPGADVGGDIDYTAEDAQGLVAALNKTITGDSVHLSEDQLACMKPYIKRIFDIVIPPPSPADHSNIDEEPGNSGVAEMAKLRICPLLNDSESFFAVSFDGTTQNISGWYPANKCIIRPAAPDSNAVFIAAVGRFNGTFSELSQNGHTVNLPVCVDGTVDDGIHEYTKLGGFSRRNGKWRKNCTLKKDTVSYYRVSIGHSNDIIRVDRSE
jgi:hypothetical protein